ncbi:MAG: ArsA family ATPase [Dehalococcoidia bacterium]
MPVYEIRVDKNLDITSSRGGEDEVATQGVIHQLYSALDRRKGKPSPISEVEREERAVAQLIEQALREIGQVVKLERADGGWATQLEPWKAIRLRRRFMRYRRRPKPPPVIYEIKLDPEFGITSCAGGEDPTLTEQVIGELRTAIERRVREPVQKSKAAEEELRKPRVPPAELEREYQEAKRREEWQRTASFLENESLQLILFGGKGGSGKTTSAASTALRLARLHPEKKILVVSIDPAHSLGDSFDLPLGSAPAPVKGVENLWAMELDAKKAHDEFRQRHDEAMKKIAYRGSIFDPDDIADVFALALPGIDEFMAIVEIANIRRKGEYDLIILDTAPTGHTLRLLSLPDTILRWMHVFDLMQEKHRYLSRHLSGHYRKDDADEFIALMVGDVRRVKSLLSNIRITEFVPVTIPEPMSIYETQRFVATLKDYNIPVKSIIVNRLAAGDGCIFCQSRRRDQEGNVAEIDQRFGSYNLFRTPLFPHEIRGMEGLTEYADILSGKAYRYQPPPLEAPLPRLAGIPAAQMSELLERNLRFILFGGKGGVGKTSMAAATSLALAQRNPGKKVLAFSMDPAHSLSDAFGYPIGDEAVLVKGVENLYGIEINPDVLWEELKKDYKEDMLKIIDRFLGSTVGSSVQFEREASTEFIELSPPGLNEIMALEKLMDFYEEGAYDLYVVDTAATGHLIRFLELPELIADWLQVLFKLLLKYRRVVRLADLPKAGWRLLRTSKHVRQIRAALVDPERTEFVAVTIPEAMGVLETGDLLSTLGKLGIPCRHIVMNMMIPSTECSFCAAKRVEQQESMERMEKAKPPQCQIAMVPLLPHQIKGMDALELLAEIAFGK